MSNTEDRNYKLDQFGPCIQKIGTTMAGDNSSSVLGFTRITLTNEFNALHLPFSNRKQRKGPPSKYYVLLTIKYIDTNFNNISIYYSFADL